MAKRGSAEDSTVLPGPGSNSKARGEIIIESFERLYKLDAEIDRVIEQEVQGFRDEKGTIKKKLREDLGMPSPLVQARYAAYRMERAAEDASDDITMRAIRELYKVLPVGGQVDLVDVMQRPDDRTPAQIAHAEGRRARVARQGLETCPYTKPNQKRLKSEWESGYESEAFESQSMGEQPAEAVM